MKGCSQVFGFSCALLLLFALCAVGGSWFVIAVVVLIIVGVILQQSKADPEPKPQPPAIQPYEDGAPSEAAPRNNGGSKRLLRVQCEACGGASFQVKGDFLVCQHCGRNYLCGA